MSKDNLQVGAICFRETNKKSLDILLVTSRDTGRWIIPKGWPKEGDTLHQSAAREAFEEAGVEGSISSKPIGQFPYIKREKNGVRQLQVTVFPLRVEAKKNHWPEDKERKRKWFQIQEATDKVEEPELAALIKGLAASWIKKKIMVQK